MAKELTGPTRTFAELLDWFESGGPFSLRGLGLTPYVRVEDFEEDGMYVLRAEMPGIDPDKDVTLTVEDGVLTISGERREEKKEKHRQEWHYGSFTRSLTLPRGVDPDKITASYEDGVLEVRVPKAEPSTNAVTIKVNRNEK
ncbi:MAG: Hsp20/alpha crystallin family protein [Actinomycetales bacterium]|nr:Hsp20/alpha crystallin family protein [Actinomycetales bacterium]